MIGSDRRAGTRAQSPSRRAAGRPSLRFNLIVLVLALALLAGAWQHRRGIDAGFASLARKQAASPFLVAKIRSDLASMELTQESLEQEIQNRLTMVQAFQAEQFYLAIDTTGRRMRLHFGPEIVREADVVVGEPRVVKVGGKSWEFAALKGAVSVTGKLADAPWEVPAWAHALRDDSPPVDAVTVPGGLGRFVVLLPNGYLIHTPPPEGSPLQGAKPGSFMIAEGEMQAMWPRISAGTRVYIY